MYADDEKEKGDMSHLGDCSDKPPTADVDTDTNGEVHGVRKSSMYIDTVYTNAKAGMDRVDQERVKQVVYDLSKGSSYFENEVRKNKLTEDRIENLRRKLHSLQNQELCQYRELARQDIIRKECARHLERVWLHVDMDAFYCAVEQILDPRLLNVPFAVGGIGMISTANYLARKYGVRSAMPGFIGRELCPELQFVSPKFSEYKRFSDKTRDVFRQFDAEFESGSMDEAYLDVTEYLQAHGMSSVECADEMRKLIRLRTGGLTCSVGIAPNKLIAKICSDINKPDGVFAVSHDPQKIRDFMNSLEVRKIPGIGRVSSKLLNSVLGVSICGDILEKAGEIKAIFSEKSYDFFVTSALGLGATLHGVQNEDASLVGRKSKSVERTFTPTSSVSELQKKLSTISQTLEHDLKVEGLHGKTLVLKIKFSTFVVKTKATTLAKYTDSKDEMYEHAVVLLNSFLASEKTTGVRLMGLRMSNFLEEQQQEQRDPCQPTLKDMFTSSLVPRKPKHTLPVPTKKVDDEWDCVSCTYRNISEERWCAMCLTSRKTGVLPFTNSTSPESSSTLKKKKKKNNGIHIKDFLVTHTS